MIFYKWSNWGYFIKKYKHALSYHNSKSQSHTPEQALTTKPILFPFHHMDASKVPGLLCDRSIYSEPWKIKTGDYCPLRRVLIRHACFLDHSENLYYPHAYENFLKEKSS